MVKISIDPFNYIFIEDISSRFGKLVLCEDDRDGKKPTTDYTTDRTNDEIDKELNEYLKQKALNSKIKRDLSKKKEKVLN